MPKKQFPVIHIQHSEQLGNRNNPPKAFPMKRAKTILTQSLKVFLGSVSFVVFEIIIRINMMIFFHYSITDDLGYY
jgi:hypothetical protein